MGIKYSNCKYIYFNKIYTMIPLNFQKTKIEILILFKYFKNVSRARPIIMVFTQLVKEKIHRLEFGGNASVVFLCFVQCKVFQICY